MRDVLCGVSLRLVMCYFVLLRESTSCVMSLREENHG